MYCVPTVEAVGNIYYIEFKTLPVVSTMGYGLRSYIAYQRLKPLAIFTTSNLNIARGFNHGIRFEIIYCVPTVETVGNIYYIEFKTLPVVSTTGYGLRSYIAYQRLKPLAMFTHQIKTLREGSNYDYNYVIQFISTWWHSLQQKKFVKIWNNILNKTQFKIDYFCRN